MRGFMRRNKSKSGQALLARARELGVGLPDWSIAAAQNEVEISDELREAAEGLAQQMVASEASANRAASTPGHANGRRAKPRRELRLNI
jgi:hypothetical protein